VGIARAAGARKVYFGVTSPPLQAPCPYGIDMASKREFIATDRDNDAIADSLGVDHLVYLSREAMNAAARKGNEKIEKFCNACFNGEYPTGDITVERLQAIEAERSSQRDNVPVH
jgi:amidophosphoribosyltransferase